MKLKLVVNFLFLLFVLTPFINLAQDGSLDVSFGSAGIVTTSVGTYSHANSVVLQSDGKIVVVGQSHNGLNYDFTLLRYNGNGSLDTSFGVNGKVITNHNGNDLSRAVAIQNDGKILVAGTNASGFGSTNFALFRYNANGSLDTTFDIDGKVTTNFNGGDCHASSLVIQNDGKIVVAGDARNGLGDSGFASIRYNSDGSLDSTFGTAGKVFTLFGNSSASSTSIALQNDGKIVIAGSDYTNYVGGGGTSSFAVARYNADGSLDTTFDNDGKITTSFGVFTNEAISLALQNDGKIILSGNSAIANFGTEIFAVVRFNSDGSLDTTFDNDGKVTTTVGTFMNRLYSTIVQNDGKILISGYSNSLNDNVFTLLRYNTDGSLDTSFDTDGIVNSISDSSAYAGAYSLALQNDGKIIVAGLLNNSFAVVRYNNSSLSNNSFENQKGIKIYPNPFSKETILHANDFFENATLSIYNSFGQLVKYIKSINGQSITISRENLPKGLYFVNIFQDNKSIAIEKIIVTD
jgi:uncharacterized delta-60 repeat protein